MKFKIDENLPARLETTLSKTGHDAMSVVDQQLTGESDARIASVCKAEGRVLLTLDIGFADIRRYPPAEYPGLIVFRLRRQDAPHVRATVENLLPLLEEQPVSQTLWIVEEHRVRFRQ
jgi:predicted nuclease of predicted toxin-antitoxin system